MICKNCGADNPDYYVFCQNCFADLNESREAEPAPPQRATPPQRPPRQEAYRGQEPAYGARGTNHEQPTVGYEQPREQEAPSYEEPPRRRQPAQTGGSPSAPPPSPQPTQRGDSPRVIYTDETEGASQYEDAYYYTEDEGVQDRMGEEQPASNRRPPAGPAPVRRDTSSRRRPPAAPVAKESVSLDNAVSQGVSPRELRQRERQAQRDARELEKLATNAGAEYYDYYDYYDEAAVQREKTRSKKTGLIIGIIILVLLVAAVVLGILYANNTYGSVSAAIDSIFGGSLGSGEAVTVEADVDESGNPGRRITIRAKTGQRIAFMDELIANEYEVTSNEPRAFFIPDDAWIPEEPTEDQAVITVNPEIYLVEKTGSQTKLEVPSFTVDVPQATLTITEPALQQGNVADSNVLTISGVAASGNGNQVRVLVNEYELPSPANLQADGTFTCQASIQGMEYSIPVVAKATRCRPVTIVLTGTVGEGAGAAAPGNGSAAAAASGSFVLDDGVAMQTELTELTVTGVAPTGGAEMTVRGTAGNIEYDNVTGRFSFIARLSDMGLNTFVLQVGDQSETFVFRRVPNVNEYTGQAVSLDFNYALENQSEVFNKVFSFMGTVLEIQEESPAYAFTVAVDGDASKVVQVTYYGLDVPKVGETFLIYATALGNANENSQLRMSAYFMYSEDVLASLEGNAAAEEPTE